MHVKISSRAMSDLNLDPSSSSINYAQALEVRLLDPQKISHIEKFYSGNCTLQ